jgi:hypothetical protein
MNDELGRRRVHHWIGKDRQADIAELINAITETIALFDHDGAIVRLDGDGQLVNINRNDLHALITEHICGLRVVKNGSGRYQRQYFSYQFATSGPRQQPRPEDFGKPEVVSHEPDMLALDEIYRHRLLERLPKVEG